MSNHIKECSCAILSALMHHHRINIAASVVPLFCCPSASSESSDGCDGYFILTDSDPKQEPGEEPLLCLSCRVRQSSNSTVVDHDPICLSCSEHIHTETYVSHKLRTFPHFAPQVVHFCNEDCFESFISNSERPFFSCKGPVCDGAYLPFHHPYNPDVSFRVTKVIDDALKEYCHSCFHSLPSSAIVEAPSKKLKQ